MIYLFLAIASSALVSLIMRLGEGRIRNNMGMFITNYLVCTLLSLYFCSGRALFSASEGRALAVGLGIISGILYLFSFVLLQINIGRNGIVLSSTFMKLGVIIPTLMAAIVFGEVPGPARIIGILLAIAAIILINFEKGSTGAASYKLLLILLLLGNGITDSMAGIYEKVGNPALKDEYLLITFFMAGVCAFILWLKEKQGICRWDIIFGVLIGIPNYFSSRFLLAALNKVPAIVVYPVVSVGTIIAITLVSLLVFREKLSRRKAVAIGIILVALVLINI